MEYFYWAACLTFAFYLAMSPHREWRAVGWANAVVILAVMLGVVGGRESNESDSQPTERLEQIRNG